MSRQQVRPSSMEWQISGQRRIRGDYGRRQCGAAALLVTLILVIIASLSALVVNTAAFNEQKLSGNDIRSKEVYAAAVGALEYGASQLELAYFDADSGLAWPSGILAGLAGETVTAAPFVNAAAGATIDQQADTYTPTVVYTLLTDESASPAIIEVAATAVAEGDTHITKTITMQYLISDFGTASLWDGPPLAIENCLSDVTGTPDIYSDDIAIGSLNGAEACVDPGAFDLNGDPISIGDASIAWDTNGTHVDEDGDPDPLTLSLHETFFGVTTAAQLKAISEKEAEANRGPADRTVYYIDAYFSDPTGLTDWNGNSWSDDIGSGTTGPGNTAPYTIDHAVVLYFDESVGCPPINGNVEIWGLVFYQAVSCDTQIGAQGGGKADVYGTVAFSGDLNKYTANTNIYDVDLSGGGGGLKDIKIVTALPSSWVDF
ncbi:MAG: pilus assembly PilX N-terminal domain-containing protein [Gammaproteobacteria bacterium]|nr:pilus assembly PilX N-terminal domain-containing protein [Gammaproteobacteria bacterium]